MQRAFCVISVMVIIAITNIASGEELKFSFSTKVAPEYVFNNGAMAYDGNIIQSNLRFSFRKFYLGIWNSTPIQSKDDLGPLGKETIYSAGFKKDFFEKFFFDVGTLYHDMNLRFTDEGGQWRSNDDLMKIYSELGIKGEFSSAQSWATSLRIEKFIPLSRNSPKNGTWTFLSFVHKWKFNQNTSLFQQARLLFDDGAAGKDKGVIGRYIIRLDQKITKSISLNLEMKINTPITHVDDGRKTETTPSIGLTYNY